MRLVTYLAFDGVLTLESAFFNKGNANKIFSVFLKTQHFLFNHF